jgi:hypothetical protein
MTISVGTSTAAGSYPITVTASGGGVQHTTTVTVSVSGTGSAQVAIVGCEYITWGRGLQRVSLNDFRWAVHDAEFQPAVHHQLH